MGMEMVTKELANRVHGVAFWGDEGEEGIQSVL